MPDQTQSASILEIVKVFISLLTPIMTGSIALVIFLLGTRLDRTKQLHHSLLGKRMSLFEQVAPLINDVYCFFQAVGHWAELNPEEVIKRKRAIDRALNINRYLFGARFWDAYKAFETLHFEMFASPGQPARLRLDTSYVRERLGPYFKKEWENYLSTQPGSRQAQAESYNRLMDTFGSEVKGEAA